MKRRGGESTLYRGLKLLCLGLIVIFLACCGPDDSGSHNVGDFLDSPSTNYLVDTDNEFITGGVSNESTSGDEEFSEEAGGPPELEEELVEIVEVEEELISDDSNDDRLIKRLNKLKKRKKRIRKRIRKLRERKKRIKGIIERIEERLNS